MFQANVENTEAGGVKILDSINIGKTAVITEEVKQALEGNASSGTPENRHKGNEDEVSGSTKIIESRGDEEESSENAGSAIVKKEVPEIRADKEKNVEVSESPIVIKEVTENMDKETSVEVLESPIVIKEVSESVQKEKGVGFSELPIVTKDKQKTVEAVGTRALEITEVKGSVGCTESAKGISKIKGEEKVDHAELEEFDTDDSMEVEKEFQELTETALFPTPDGVIVKRDILQNSEGILNDELEKQFLNVKQELMKLEGYLRVIKPTITITDLSQSTSSELSSRTEVDVLVKSTPEGSDESIKGGIVIEAQPKQESQAVPTGSVSIATITSKPVPEEKHESKTETK